VTDVIRVSGLRVSMRIGVNEEERAQPRPIVIDLEIRADTRLAGKSDDLADTADYSQIISRIVTSVAHEEVRLLEHLAERIADLAVNTPLVESVAVEVRKESPPVEADVDSVSVRIERP
jgi:dihydroneopterin aldolase